MNWQQRSGRIYADILEQGKRSVRAIAIATGMTKSSVHRLLQASKRRQQYPESPLWEHQSGYQWLQRLVWAVVYVFGVKRGIGNETLSEFFHLVHLQERIGVSPNAIQGIRVQLEGQILRYQDEQQAHLEESETKVEVCGGADETFFEQMVLVLLDLPSGYIFVESQSASRDYQTWQERVQQAVGPIAQVKYLVSDRAKALVKLALDELGCRSIPDLFHALRGLSRAIGSPLALQLSRLDKQCAQAQATLTHLQAQGKPNQTQQVKLAQLQAQFRRLQSTQATYHHLLQQLSLNVHPFAIDGGGFQCATEVSACLQEHLQALTALGKQADLPKIPAAVRQFSDQISGIAAVVHAWWTWVLQSLATDSLSPEVNNWVLTCLLPAAYWQQQLHKTKTLALKQAYRAAYAQAQAAFTRDPVTLRLSPESLQQWWSWAEWMVSKFQRTSSPVEGRNGYLARLHHSARGLSQRRLQVLTVIHNFALTRSDGTTAAERLFSKQFPDLFEYLVAHMGELPQPRKKSKLPRLKVPTLQGVPA